ncbi:hypothetical protein M9Y10_015949 [Tritrichomonas musculus]|uniref:Uncharacterized protein n=1 Tax=Tritrichomonas musculus TaxID=1915356 RepID=A0ABR2I644_9EUKA
MSTLISCLNSSNIIDSHSEFGSAPSIVDDDQYRNLIFDPSLMIIGTEQIIEKYNLNSNNEQLKEWYVELSKIKYQLFNKTLDTKCNIDRNTKWIADAVNVFDSLPPLLAFSKSKPVIPEFDEILVESTDTAELKKFIRKVNYEMLGYHCNHKVMNEQCDQVFKHIADIYHSKEYIEYESFIDKIAKFIYEVRESDKYNKAYKSFDNLQLPIVSQIKHMIDNIIQINGSITAYNAKTNPECSKCKSAVRKYEYSLREITRMRAEIKSLHQEIKSSPADSKYDIYKFISKNYSNIDRVPLRDVKDRYKQEFNISLTFDKLTNLIEGTKLFKISNTHNVKYMVRL